MQPAKLSARSIETAITRNEQDLSNEVLYEMCRRYPNHKKPDEIYAKLLIIGRVYAASLQRRRLVDETGRGDKFFDIALPKIVRAKIDLLFRPLIVSPIDVTISDQYDREVIYNIHRQLTEVFYQLSGQMNRSLASKYLHFHFPRSFYIYDFRASGAVSRMTARGDRHPSNGNFDMKYVNFVDRCEKLNSKVQGITGRRLSPRELDKLLLHMC